MMNNSYSNIFLVHLLLERYYKICQGFLAAAGMNRLNMEWLKILCIEIPIPRAV